MRHAFPLQVDRIGGTAQARACGGDFSLSKAARGASYEPSSPPEGLGEGSNRDGHCDFVERDGYVSVQVNVDVLGRNIFGDFNGDSRLDLRDYQGMQLCLGAPSADLPGPRCTRLDLDGDVDLDDHTAFVTVQSP